MYGFTESFNISVSAALCMQELTRKMHQSVSGWQLSAEDELDVRLEWARSVVKQADNIEKSLFLPL